MLTLKDNASKAAEKFNNLSLQFSSDGHYEVYEEPEMDIEQRIEYLLLQEQLKKEKHMKLQAEKLQLEMKECTFQPTLCKGTQKRSKNGIYNYSDGQNSKLTTASNKDKGQSKKNTNGNDVSDRLYLLGKKKLIDSYSKASLAQEELEKQA